MKLADQLQELRENILRDTSDLISGGDDLLWSDETLLRYIGDAERRFARRTLLLRDNSTPQVVQVKLKQGVTTYALHESIIAVIAGKFDTAQNDLIRANHGMITPIGARTFMTWNPAEPYQIPPGVPIAIATDETTVFDCEERVTLTVYPAPAAAQDGLYIHLRVARMPLGCYDKAHLQQKSGIPTDYQFDMLRWAAYRALSTYDADAGAPTTAETHRQAFEDAVTKAQQELKRKLIGAIGMRYGTNGFAWVR